MDDAWIRAMCGPLDKSSGGIFIGEQFLGIISKAKGQSARPAEGTGWTPLKYLCAYVAQHQGRVFVWGL